MWETGGGRVQGTLLISFAETPLAAFVVDQNVGGGGRERRGVRFTYPHSRPVFGGLFSAPLPPFPSEFVDPK